MPGLWGDGFAGDSLLSTLSMTDWDACSADEYAVLFPRLVPSDGVLPPALCRHLESCVAERARRAGAGRAWRPESGFDSLLRRAGLRRDAPGRLALERRLLDLLGGVLDEVRRGLAPAWSPDREAWFAFGSGIHPAYLWPESAASPDRGYAAAWLGHLDRGRAALMPPAVAGYLADAVLDPSRPRDRALAAMVGEDAPRLRRAAARRLQGADPVVRLGRARRWHGGAGAEGGSGLLSTLEGALEPA